MGWQNIRNFARDESGAALIYVGMTMFAIAGFAGLAIDVGHWYSTQRAAQTAADSAAVAGAREAMWGGNAAAIKAAAEAQAALNGFPASAVSVDSNYTHTNGATTTTAVEVIIQQPTQGFLGSMIRQGDNSVNIAARSVSGPVDGVGACLLTLSPTGVSNLLLSGGSTISATGCGIQVNSDDPRAIKLGGGATITAEAVTTSGGFEGTSESYVTGDTGTGVPSLPDPLAYLPPPAIGACGDHPAPVVGVGETTYGPGTYCGPLEASGGDHLVFKKGTYIIVNGGLKSGGGGEIRMDPADWAAGEGVGFYFTGAGSEDKVVEVSGGGTVTLRAQQDGPMEGIIFWGATDLPSGTEAVFGGGAGTVYEGTLYFPNVDLEYSGGSGATVSVGAILAHSFQSGGGGSLVMNDSFAGAGAIAGALGAQSIAILE